jgi:spore coat protein H
MNPEKIRRRGTVGGLGLWLLVTGTTIIRAETPPATPAKTAATVAPAAQRAARDEVFDPAPLRKLSIQITGAEWDKLHRDDRQYVRATFRDGDTVLKDVGVHNKGSAGSRRSVDDLPALTVHFDKFVPGQQWHGLSKVHFNNSVQDPSKLTENLCAELFRQAGVPMPRVTNVRLQLNQRDLGVYVMLEGLDKPFLKRHLAGARGNLYDGGFCHDIEQPLELVSGEAVREQPEIKALVAAAHEPDLAKRWTRLEQLLDMDRFITFCALEVMTHDWDGYVLKPNNYKIFWDRAANRITFFPHGMDQMFWEPKLPILPGMNGLVSRAVVATPEGRRRYLARMTELTTNVFKADVMINRINAYAAPVHASLAEHNADAARNYDGQVQRIRDLVSARATFLTQQLFPAPGRTLKFQDGVAQLKDWQTEFEPGVAARAPGEGAKGGGALSLTAGERTTPSWRVQLRLPAGRYRFEAMVRTAGVAAMKDNVGEGAGIRSASVRQKRSNQLAGDSAWQTLSYEFEAPAPPEEVTLVCELRATKGRAWFDVDSLRLTKL